MYSKELFKRCGCRNPDTGQPYNSRCPQLFRSNGSWDPHHGTWCFQIELPIDTTGRRRQLKRGGFASATDAQADLDHARRLLNLAGKDRDLRRHVGDLLAAVRAKDRLPDEDEVRRLHHGVDVSVNPTVAEYLTGWLNYLAVSRASRVAQCAATTASFASI